MLPAAFPAAHAWMDAAPGEGSAGPGREAGMGACGAAGRRRQGQRKPEAAAERGTFFCAAKESAGKGESPGAGPAERRQKFPQRPKRRALFFAAESIRPHRACETKAPAARSLCGGHGEGQELFGRKGSTVACLAGAFFSPPSGFSGIRRQGRRSSCRGSGGFLRMASRSSHLVLKSWFLPRTA